MFLFELWGLPPLWAGVALFGVSAAFGGPSAPTIARPKKLRIKTLI